MAGVIRVRNLALKLASMGMFGPGQASQAAAAPVPAPTGVSQPVISGKFKNPLHPSPIPAD